jgi:hypothetical protein
MSFPTTDDQAESARVAVDAFSALTDPEEDEDKPTHFADLICALRHYADKFGIDFHEALDWSYHDYLKELNAEANAVRRPEHDAVDRALAKRQRATSGRVDTKATEGEP